MSFQAFKMIGGSGGGTLSDPQKATALFYCQQCRKNFINEEALQNHKWSSESFRCDGCRRTFCSLKKLRTHQRSTQHCYCKTCDHFFAAAESLKSHCAALHIDINDQKKKSAGATQGFHCCDCERDFVSEQALTQHCEMKVHTKKDPKTKSHPCSKCKRIFKSQKALQQHLASLAHKPLGDVKCVASSDCKGRFSSPSGLVQHLESGKCCSGMTRKKLNGLVQSNDVDRIISAGPQEKGLISSAPQNSDSNSDSDSDDGVPIYTPISSGSLTPALNPTVHDLLNTLLFENTSTDSLLSGLLAPQSSTELSDQAQTPTIASLFCPLCPPTRKAFVNTVALEMHLASPKHAPKAFHCPKNLFAPSTSAVSKKKNRAAVIMEFSTLSGLTQHLESGACRGGKGGLKAAMKLLEKRLTEIGFKHQSLLRI